MGGRLFGGSYGFTLVLRGVRLPWKVERSRFASSRRSYDDDACVLPGDVFPPRLCASRVCLVVPAFAWFPDN
jgi:hypothetical protein